MMSIMHCEICIRRGRRKASDAMRNEQIQPRRQLYVCIAMNLSLVQLYSNRWVAIPLDLHACFAGFYPPSTRKWILSMRMHNSEVIGTWIFTALRIHSHSLFCTSIYRMADSAWTLNLISSKLRPFVQQHPRLNPRVHQTFEDVWYEGAEPRDSAMPTTEPPVWFVAPHVTSSFRINVCLTIYLKITSS